MNNSRPTALWLSVLCLLILPTMAASQTAVSVERAPFVTSSGEARHLAGERGQYALLDFYTDW